jgi:hypothetical protein
MSTTTTEQRFLALLDDVLLLVGKYAMSDRQGQSMFEAAMHGIGSWRIVGITEDAARALIDSGFNTKLVCRAHRVSRKDTFIALRDRVPRDEAFAFYVASDMTTIATKAENGKPGEAHWSPVHPIPASVGELRATFGVRFTKTQKLALVEAFLPSERGPRGQAPTDHSSGRAA